MVAGYVGNDDCKVPYCHFCGLTLPTSFKLTGLCQGSIIDTEYLLDIAKDGEVLEFSGFSQTDIKKNEDSNKWEIVDVLDSSIVRARTVEKSSSDREYPLGAMSWMSLNDSCGAGVTKFKISECEKVGTDFEESNLALFNSRMSLHAMMVVA